MAKQPKYYVVWHGRETGVFDSWEACKEQMHGFEGAIYKSFLSREAAETAIASESSFYIGRRSLVNRLPEDKLAKIGIPIEDSIAVDGAWNTTTGLVEYQGVNNETLFHVGPLEAETSALEREIDLMVYELYGLSEEEIWIVENN